MMSNPAFYDQPAPGSRRSPRRHLPLRVGGRPRTGSPTGAGGSRAQPPTSAAFAAAARRSLRVLPLAIGLAVPGFAHADLDYDFTPVTQQIAALLA